MEKRISYQQFQQVKSAAKMINPLQCKLQPIEEKIKALAEEYKGYQTQIAALEEGIVKVVGFHVADLVKKVMVPTGAVDKNGNALKTAKYLPTDIVTYDEVKKQYVITAPDEEDGTIVPPTTEDGPGTDFDEDKEQVEESVETLF